MNIPMSKDTENLRIFITKHLIDNPLLVYRGRLQLTKLDGMLKPISNGPNAKLQTCQ